MVILKCRIPVMFVSLFVVCSELSVVSTQNGIGLVFLGGGQIVQQCYSFHRIF